MRCKLEPAIWSCDTGQHIPCFEKCQLILVWMSNVKKVHGKPRLCLFFWSMAAMLGNSAVVVVVHTRPRSTPLAMITMRKSTHGFPFLSHDAAGAPLKYSVKMAYLIPYVCCLLLVWLFYRFNLI